VIVKTTPDVKSLVLVLANLDVRIDDVNGDLHLGSDSEDDS
jgi:hypothetical protein